MTVAQTERAESPIDGVLLDALRDGWESSSRIIREMFDAPVSFGEPIVRIADALDVQAGSIAVAMEFEGKRSGLGVLSVPRPTARVLVASLLGCGDSDVAVLPMLGPAVLELGNIVLNSIIGDVGERLVEAYRFEVPTSLHSSMLRSHEVRAETIGILKGWVTVNGQAPTSMVVGILLHAEGVG